MTKIAVKQFELGNSVTIRNQQYTLVNEKVNKGCKGCAFEHSYACYKTLTSDNIKVTDVCRQGFVFNKK